MSGLMHGHHVYGAQGYDKFVFTNVDDLRGTVVGRLDDFNSHSDSLWIGEHRIDLSNPNAVEGYDVRLVLYRDQQWLDIRNSDGGRVFYALEGARRFFDGENDLIGKEEDHFLPRGHKLPDVLPETTWVEPDDTIPQHTIDEFLAKNPIDSVIQTGGQAEPRHIIGTDDNNHIISGRGNDLIEAKGGSNLIFAQWGNDTIYGGEGDNLIHGGKGNDLIYGGPGNDTIYGGLDDDIIYGGAGNDVLYGGSGNDTLYSGAGHDTLYGGTGDDWLHAEGETTRAYGGEGNDTFTIAKGTILTIPDFDPSGDRLAITEHFEDLADLAEFVYAVEDPDDANITDLVIEIPGGGSILIPGMGEYAEHPARITLGWEHLDPVEEPGIQPDDDDQQEDDDADDVDVDDGGFDIGFLLLAGLFGALLMLGAGGG